METNLHRKELKEMLYKMNPVITLRDFLMDKKLSLLCFPYVICFFTGGAKLDYSWLFIQLKPLSQ